MPEFRTAYGPKKKSTLNCPANESRTKQSFKAECDVNLIVRKFAKTGAMEHLNQYQGEYGEFEAIDYQTALNAVIAAQEMFNSLPSAVRSRFGNDPGAFVEFAQDRANIDTMREWGLAEPERPPASPASPASTPAAAEPPAEGSAPPPPMGRQRRNSTVTFLM